VLYHLSHFTSPDSQNGDAIILSQCGVNLGNIYFSLLAALHQFKKCNFASPPICDIREKMMK
jgi:hypothetical protein